MVLGSEYRRFNPRLVPLPLSLRERARERVQAGLLKTPSIQIYPSLPACSCVWYRAETHTLTLSLVWERASIRFSLNNSILAVFTPQDPFFDSLWSGRGASKWSSLPTAFVQFGPYNRFIDNL